MKWSAIIVPLGTVILLLSGCPDPVGDNSTDSDNAPPIVTLSPESATVANGENQEFEVTATDPDGDTLSITWYLNDVVVEGETGNLCVFCLAPAEETVYPVRVGVNDGTVTVSKNATLTVLAPEVIDPEGTAEITSDSPADDYISYAGEEDWYKIAVTEGDVLQISVSQPESGMDPAVALFSQVDFENYIWSTYDLSEPASIVSEWQRVETTGFYYIRVTGANESSDPTVPYVLTVAVTGEPESAVREPANNDYSGAVVLSSGVSDNDGYISYEGDEDWYKIAVTEGDVLQISVSQPESGMDPAVALFSQVDFENYIWSTYDLSEPASIVSEWQRVETTGFYYIRVTGANESSDPTVPYVLTVAVTGEPESAVREPANNDYSGAVVLTSGVSDNDGYISYEGDEDWFRIAVTTGDVLRIEITQPESTVDPAVAPFVSGDFDTSIWSEYDSGEPASIVIEDELVETTGDYYLRITSANNHSDPSVPYTLTVTVGP